MAILLRWIEKRRTLGLTGRQRLFCTLQGRPLQPSYEPPAAAGATPISRSTANTSPTTRVVRFIALLLFAYPRP
jgi:hypothetical protein